MPKKLIFVLLLSIIFLFVFGGKWGWAIRSPGPEFGSSEPPLPTNNETPIFLLYNDLGDILLGNPQTPIQIRQALETYIQKNPELFGDMNPQQLRLDYLHEYTAPLMKKMVYVRYVQSINGVDVYGSHLTFSLKMLTNECRLMSSTVRFYTGIPALNFNGMSPAMTEQRLTQRMGSTVINKEIKNLGRTIKWLDKKWMVVDTFAMQGTMSDVNILTGDIKTYTSLHFFDVTGSVKGKGNIFDPRSDGDNRDTLDLPNVKVEVPGSQVQADDKGLFRISTQNNDPVDVKVTLQGKWVKVASDEKDFTSLTQPANQNSNQIDFVFNSGGLDEAQTAEVNAFYHVNKIHDWVVLNGIDHQQLNRDILTTVNIPFSIVIPFPDPITCNAFFDPGFKSLNFYTSAVNNDGNHCLNSAYDSIIYHEYGHLVDDSIGGIHDFALSEGWGDIISTFFTNQPIVAEGFWLDKVPSYFRAYDQANNGYQYNPLDYDPHIVGQAWAGFAWDLRNSLGVQLTTELLFAVMWKDSLTIPEAVREVVIADDNDGDLKNKTPHYDLILAAAEKHNLGSYVIGGFGIKIVAPKDNTVMREPTEILVEREPTIEINRVSFFFKNDLKTLTMVAYTAPFQVTFKGCFFPNGPIDLLAKGYAKDGQQYLDKKTYLIQSSEPDQTAPTIRLFGNNDPVYVPDSEEPILLSISDNCGVEEIFFTLYKDKDGILEAVNNGRIKGKAEPLIEFYQPRPFHTDAAPFVAGKYQLEITAKDSWNNETTKKFGINYLLGKSAVRGDVDGDGKLLISDPILILRYLFQGAEAPACLKSADVDGDNSLSITDPIYLLRFLFLGGPPPAEGTFACEVPGEGGGGGGAVVVNKKVTPQQLEELRQMPGGEGLAQMILDSGQGPAVDLDAGQIKLVGNVINRENSGVTIYFNPLNAGHVTMKIFTIKGEFIKTVLDSDQPIGIGSVIWPGDNDSGEKVSSGIYVMFADGPGFKTKKKIAVVR